MVTDANTNVIARHDYMPFGEEIPDGIAGKSGQFDAFDNVNRKFTGQERDRRPLSISSRHGITRRAWGGL